MFDATQSFNYFETQKNYQNKHCFNGVYSIENLPNIVRSGTYIMNLDEYDDIGTYWIGLVFMLKVMLQHILIGLVLNIIQNEIRKFIVN